VARAREHVGVLHPGETLAVILVTDGWDVGVRLAGELALLPAGTCHVIIADESDSFALEPWQNLPLGGITVLPRFDAADLFTANGAAVAKALGLQLQQPSSTNTRTSR
jgi:hypothetical protein